MNSGNLEILGDAVCFSVDLLLVVRARAWSTYAWIQDVLPEHWDGYGARRALRVVRAAQEELEAFEGVVI